VHSRCAEPIQLSQTVGPLEGHSDAGQPVTFDDKPPFAFEGTIKNVTIEVR
jgi:hypothetical protein